MRIKRKKVTFKRAAPSVQRRSRREAITDGVLKVIARRGVEGLTHRRVASAARVPLGSTTYYFKGIEDMLVAAMSALVDRDLQRLKGYFDSIPRGANLAPVMTALVLDGVTHDRDNTILAHELSVASLRRVRLREIAEPWDQHWQRVLQDHVGAVRAATVTATAAWLMHQLLLQRKPPDKKLILAMMRQALGEARTRNRR